MPCITITLRTKIMLKRILNIAIPSGLQGLFDMLSVSMALFFLGDISPLNFTALSTGASYIFVFFPLSAIFGMGTNVLMSRRFGAKNFGEMNDVYSTMNLASSLCSLLVLLLAWAFLPSYLGLFNLSSELYALTFSYVSLTIFAIPSIMIKNVLISGFAATGDTKRPFYIKIFLTFFSILGYYAFINGNLFMPRLELVGAAYVTLVISYLELFLLFILPLFVKTRLKLRPRFNISFLLSALKVGFPTALERVFGMVAINIVLIFVGQYASVYGDSAITGFKAGGQIEGFSFLPGFGFMIAVMSLVGQSIGAKKLHLAQDYTQLSVRIASVILGVCGVILAVFAKPLVEIFIKQDSTGVEIAIAYLLAVGLSQVPLIMAFIYDGAIRGAGWTQIPLFINICSITLFRLVPMWICSSLNAGLYTLFFIIFLETYIRAGIFYSVFKSGKWKKPREL